MACPSQLPYLWIYDSVPTQGTPLHDASWVPEQPGALQPGYSARGLVSPLSLDLHLIMKVFSTQGDIIIFVATRYSCIVYSMKIPSI